MNAERRHSGFTTAAIRLVETQCHGLKVLALLGSVAVVSSIAAPQATARDLQQQRGYELEGHIVRVKDGDTVVLRIRGVQERDVRQVRLADIDAPESCKNDALPADLGLAIPCKGKPGQPFSGAARERLTRLVDRREVVARCRERDRYGRDVCTLVVDGTDVCQALVLEGLAWYDGRYGRRPELKRFEEEARAARRGVFSRPGAVSPREWRTRCWRNAICS